MAEQNGFAEVLIINESTSNSEVYADNLSLQITSAQQVAIVQENAYLPFGLAAVGLDWNADGHRESKFTFQNKERLTDFGLHWQDFHARFYDPQIGRTPTLDPHAENYYSLSSYSFLANNPLLFVDPDGKDIIIYYRDGNSKNEQQFVLNAKTDLKTIPNNAFVKQVIAAWQYLKNNTAGKFLNSAIIDNTVSIAVKEGLTNKARGSVEWNPKVGLKTSKAILPPAMGLSHEFDHAYDFAKHKDMHDYRVSQKSETNRNEEEKRVIFGSETHDGRSLKLIGPRDYTRVDYYDGIPFIVKGDISSTKIDYDETKKYYKILSDKHPYYSLEYKKMLEKL